MKQKSGSGWQSLCDTRFRDLKPDCGRTTDAGIVDVDEWRDWSEFETTPDQQRIEDYVARFNLRGKKILHIGIGNSELARRFHRNAEFIAGTTVVDTEMRKGAALGLANYRVSMHNKHLETGRPPGKYHFIVDNNPTTFCCCLKHFRVMIDWYAASLEPDGQIVTDRVGLGWTTELEPENSRWQFTFDDLAAVAPFLGLRASRVDENIFVLSKGHPHIPRAPSRLAMFARRLERAVVTRLKVQHGRTQAT